MDDILIKYSGTVGEYLWGNSCAWIKRNCLYEVLAKLFVGQFLGRGAYFNISLTEALYKWFSKHYPNYKEKYDKQWPISRDDKGLEHLPKSFGISKNEEAKIIEILNKKVIKGRENEA